MSLHNFRSTFQAFYLRHSMEERLLPLNDETEFQNVPNTKQNQFVAQNNLPSQNLFSSSHLNTIRNIDSDCNKNRNLDIGSDVVVIKSETSTESNQPSGKVSTKFTMTEVKTYNLKKYLLFGITQIYNTVWKDLIQPYLLRRLKLHYIPRWKLQSPRWYRRK